MKTNTFHEWLIIRWFVKRTESKIILWYNGVTSVTLLLAYKFITSNGCGISLWCARTTNCFRYTLWLQLIVGIPAGCWFSSTNPWHVFIYINLFWARFHNWCMYIWIEQYTCEQAGSLILTWGENSQICFNLSHYKVELIIFPYQWYGVHTHTDTQCRQSKSLSGSLLIFHIAGN